MAATQPWRRERDATPFVSCLCVTQGRIHFMPWLLWCFDRQVWPARELLILDSSDEPFNPPPRNDVRVIAVPGCASVPAKRNLALQEARGDIVTWFDDDDWQHPLRLVWLLEALADGAPYAGSSSGWFVDLRQLRCAMHHGPPTRVVFNGAGFVREAVLPVRFRENRRRASDTHWMRLLATRYQGQEAIVTEGDLFFWLSHDHNISNPSRKRRFPHDLRVLRERIGEQAWGDTDQALERLRACVPGIAA